MKFIKVMLSARLCTAFFACFFLLVFEAECENKIQVGGIFHPDNYETELAFRYAIKRVNQYSRHDGSKTIIEPIIRRVDPKDSFKAGKIACEMTSEGVAAIFGPQSVETKGIVESICEAMEIPHIQNTWIPNPPPVDRLPKMAVKFYPNQQNLSSALAALVTDYDWKTYTVLYEDDYGLVRLQEIFKKHGPKDPPISVYQLEPKKDNRPLLKKIQLSGEIHIILDCEAENILDYLRQAHEVKLLGNYQMGNAPFQTYILTSLDAHTVDLEELNSSESNITSFRMVDPNRYEFKAVINDWIQGEQRQGRNADYNETKVQLESVLMVDAVNHFGIALHALMKTEDMTPQSISCSDPSFWGGGLSLVNFLKGKPYPGLTGRVEFNETGERNRFNLDVVELHKGIYYKIGSWDTHNGFAYTRSREHLKTILFEKLRNKTFIVSSKIGEPFLKYREAADGEVLEGNDRYEGYSMDLIAGIAELLNISFRFELTPDGKYGAYNPDTKRWDGLVGQLLERKADFAICDLTITYERKRAVDFTMPFMTLGISILFTKATKEPPDLFSFLQPFSLDVWIYMATAYLGVSILLFILARMAPKEWANPHPCDPEPEELENILTLLNSMWLALGSFLQQGSDILPKATSTRMVAGMWWFFTLIMISSYTANLAAFLTNEQMDKPIKGAEDLVKQNRIKYGTLQGGSTYNFFKNSNLSTYSRMFSVMESTRPSVFVDSNTKGIERVLKGKRLYAYFMESTSIEFYTGKTCELTKIGGELDTKGYGIAMPVNSPMRTYINDAILKMQERGKLMELKKKWWVDLNGGGECDEDDKGGDDGAAELGIDNVGGVFVVLGFGCFIALILGVCEFLWNVRQVAVEDKISMGEAFKTELLFAANVWKTEKPITKNSGSTRSSRSPSGERAPSQARSMINAATSFMRLDKIF
ncbi:glutamate receptor ionotropic, kainate 2-like isoform X1 [Arctopsyche grandis]|uniref:glutamate receptor ionotropic, kainate 2-like isoform X1 n=1 Tax=Arctopsyche grandis TaxID=121162 RepID=UPI00406D948F